MISLMMDRPVYIRAARRTPIGALAGSLSNVPAPELGAVAIRAAVEDSRLDVWDISECIMGNVLSAGTGQAPARQAALAAGLPEAVSCQTINKVCGSGMQSLILGARSILLNEASAVVAGGMENMSRVPHLLPGMRQGSKLGHGQVIDAMIHDGLWDPYNDQHMGNCGESCAREYEFSREAQDEVAAGSYRRAQESQNQGSFDAEIVPVEITTRRGVNTVEVDEGPTQVDFEKMAQLRPVFDRDGTITAANASTINDGAAALVLSSDPGEGALARIVGWGTHSGEPVNFPSAPVEAIRRALAAVEWSVSDVDLWEVNEAFAVVPMCVTHDLGVAPEQLNVHGGAISLGHPIGASGARIVVTLVHAMRQREAQRGVAAICIGGGEALAVCIERP